MLSPLFVLPACICFAPLTFGDSAVSLSLFSHATEEAVPCEPQFPIRGWESQLEYFWCRWLGGSFDWFRNERYLAYLRDAFARAPQYRINTFMLMGRGDQGEIHTFLDYQGWDKLSRRQSPEQKQRAQEQADVLESLAREASQFGVRLFLWDHELQLPGGFADLYPEARGEGASICPSSEPVWRLLADKYDEFFIKVPALAGIVLVFSETQINVLKGSSCQCELCRNTTGAHFVRKIINAALDACNRHGKMLVVRTFGHGWEEIDTILDAIRSVEPSGSFTVMSKMVPWDFFGLQLPPHPSTTALPGWPRILEDTVGGEFRGKTHTVCLPAEYYARHLRHAATHGGSGAVFRLDHSAYPRSVFETPNEFNVWLTSQLLWEPQQDLDELWRQWASNRYGQEAAPLVVDALRRSADIWEHSTNSFGLYCTSAHGHIAPFFRGGYNAYGNLLDTGPIRERSSEDSPYKLQDLLNPDIETLKAVRAERDQAVQWAVESLSALEKAKPHLDEEAYQELSHYLRIQLEAARLWRELGDLFFTGLAALQTGVFSPDLLPRLQDATEQALRQGRLIEQEFGDSHWPVAPDPDGRGTRLELAIAGLWGEILDRILGLDPLPLGSWEKRSPRSDVEKLYLALLETISKGEKREIVLEGSSKIASLNFAEMSLAIEFREGVELKLPVAVTLKGPELDGNTAYQVMIHPEDEKLNIQAIPEKPWEKLLKRELLSPDEAESMMSDFVNSHLAPLPLPESKEAWLAHRDALRQQVLEILSIDDLVPPQWDLNTQLKGVIQRDGYRIEKLTFESYPGMAVPALLYIPDNITGQVPGMVSIAGHAYREGKASDFLQQRNVNLALRGCVVLAYDYIDCGERNTGPDPRNGNPYGGGNDHGIRSFSFSRRTPTGLEALDAIRALDVLVSRPEVDPERLGFTGESGGGNSTYWITALDPRVKLSVPVSSVTTFDYWIRNDRNWDWHQRPWGIRRIADIGTLLALHAPQPILVISSLRRTDDHEFPVEEAEKSVAWAQNVYRLLDSEDAISHVESTTGHGYQEDKRRHLYSWVEQWLSPPNPEGNVDLPAELETFEELRCGLPEGNLTFRDIYASWLKPLPRSSEQEDEKFLNSFLRERLGLPERLPEVHAEKVGDEIQGNWNAEMWLFQPEPGIRLPGVLLGKEGDEGPIVLTPGRDQEAVARALSSGYRVFAFDPRGTGQMADGGGQARNWAWFAARPLVGQWALDILQATRFCRSTFPDSPVTVDALNRFGWPTLLAGAAFPDTALSGLVRIPVSTLRDHLDAHGDSALADVPGLLEYLDIPQLRALAPAIEVEVK